MEVPYFSVDVYFVVGRNSILDVYFTVDTYFTTLLEEVYSMVVNCFVTSYFNKWGDKHYKIYWYLEFWDKPSYICHYLF